MIRTLLSQKQDALARWPSVPRLQPQILPQGCHSISWQVPLDLINHHSEHQSSVLLSNAVPNVVQLL